MWGFEAGTAWIQYRIGCVIRLVHAHAFGANTIIIGNGVRSIAEFESVPVKSSLALQDLNQLGAAVNGTTMRNLRQEAASGKPYQSRPQRHEAALEHQLASRARQGERPGEADARLHVLPT